MRWIILLLILTGCETTGAGRLAYAKNPMLVFDLFPPIESSWQEVYWRDAKKELKKYESKAASSDVACTFRLDLERPRSQSVTGMNGAYYDHRLETVFYPLGEYHFLGHEYTHYIIAHSDVTEECYKETIAYLVGDKLRELHKPKSIPESGPPRL